jgi:Curli production assembly/transport component CsgG
MKSATPLLQAASAGLLLLLLPPVSAAPGKSVVGVGQITTAIPGYDPSSFQTMIETQLVRTNKFRVIERSQLEQILGEKGLSMAGITDGTGKISGVSGVDYLIYGSITKLGKDQQGVQVGGFGFSSSKIVMAMDLRVVNASTGEMLYADTVQEQMDGSSSTSLPAIRGFGGFGGGGFQSAQKQADPMADLERLTAKAITSRIVTTIYPIKVIAVQDDGTIVVNYGDSVLTVGDQLGVFHVGESFKDPDTGQVLGAEEKLVGNLKITETQDHFSKAVMINPGPAPSLGCVCHPLTTAQVAAASQSHGPALP